MTISHSSVLVAAAAFTMMAVTAASAHHGWSWAQGEQTELSGTIKSISFAPPHPSLEITAADGIDWQIDLGNPGKTEQSGFSPAVAEVGDAVTILGNRSLDENERLMKAVRITIDGRNFDMYPERIQTN